MKKQIDKLIAISKNLLRQDEDYQRLLTNIGAQTAAANSQPVSP